MLESLTLFVISLITSGIAGVFGLGGGMLLIACLPFFLPSTAIVPVHSVAQLASNFSRAGFSFRDIKWRFVPGFLVGSLLGVAMFAFVWASVPTQGIPVLIGLYILASQWSAPFNKWIRRYERFWVAGLMQSGLGLIVGATGPLTTTLLLKHSLNKDALVATNALFMCLSHLIKVGFFAIAAFAFIDYLWHILALILGAILGSYLGTKCRSVIPATQFFWVIKYLLSGLAVLMIIKVMV